MRVQEVIDLAGKPTLHLRFIFQAELTDSLLHARAGAPLRLVGFVAADVDVCARKQIHHFGEDIFHEADRRVFRVENVLMHAPDRAHLQRLIDVAQLGVRGDRCL